LLDRLPCRRSVLKFGAAATTLLSPVAAFAKALPGPETPERWLSLENTHTGEKLKTVFWQEGKYLEDSLKDLNHILRDHRQDEVMAIDKKLLDLLFALNGKLETKAPFQIISGYRSPKTNAMLASRSGGVARKSYHMKGMAMDLRLQDTSLMDVKKAALALRGGGVGYYPSSNFVHVDVGPVRDW
jgi:uncharacterized protein YcbK (DUF882 family)